MKVPRRNAITARIARKSDWSLRASWFAPSMRSSPAISTRATAKSGQLLAREPVRVRKPEQGTRPKLYYIDGDESAIVPTAARHEPTYMSSQRNEHIHGGGALYPPDSPLLQKNALAAYDVSHARPWGWQVPAYCWTKAIGSGALAIPAIAMLIGVWARSSS